nr:hypothetical protein [Tanacetum cinerariifolium]
DAFSSTHSPDYILASPNYFSASPGNTSSDPSEDLSKYLLALLAISHFHADSHMKVMQAYNATSNKLPIPPPPNYLFDESIFTEMAPKKTSTSAAPAITKAAIRKLVTDSVATHLETQVTPWHLPIIPIGTPDKEKLLGIMDFNILLVLFILSADAWNYCCVSLIDGLDLSKLAIILNELRKIYSKRLTSGDDNILNDGDHPETSNTSPPNGNGPVSVTTNTNKIIKVLPPKTTEEVVARERERKINDDDLEAIDLKWRVVMISMRIKKFHKRIGRKLQFDTKDPQKKDDRFNGNKARDNGRRPAYQDDSKALVTMNREDIDWSAHVEQDTQNYAMMAYSSSNSGSDNEVKYCSKTCEESYARLKKLYDEQRDKLGDASVEITAYTLALKKVEAQLLCHQQN